MNFIVNKYQGNVKLLLIACDEDEQNFLESHIGEVVELHAAQQPRALDVPCTCLKFDNGSKVFPMRECEGCRKSAHQ